MLSGETQNILKLSSSSSFIFENSNERNLKRFSQFSKRKNVLSSGKNLKTKNNTTNCKKENKKNRVDIINVFNLIINKYNEQNQAIMPKDIIKNNNTQNIKEINIVNNKLNIENNNHNLNEENNSVNNINTNIITKEDNNNLNLNIDSINKNEFALKYLTSSHKSFIKLDNNLKRKIKLQNNDFTDSYILALGLNEENNFKKNYKNLNNIETIKEEKENDIDIKIISLNKKLKTKNKKLYITDIINKKNKKQNQLNKAKSLPKYKSNNNFKKIKKRNLDLSLEKNNILNNNKETNSLLLNNTVMKFYENKKMKQKIIKLNIFNYDKDFASKNIERRIFERNKKINYINIFYQIN